MGGGWRGRGREKGGAIKGLLCIHGGGLDEGGDARFPSLLMAALPTDEDDFHSLTNIDTGGN